MKFKLPTIQNKTVFIFLIILALTAIGGGLSDAVYSNYFKDAYNVTSFERGLIEFPRELPGMICIFIVSFLSFLGNIRIAILAQILLVIGLAALSLLTPPFAVMLIFLFVNSLGMHLFLPLQDSIGMSLVGKNENLGKRMGQYKSVAIAFTMLTSLGVFIGFNTGFFSFTTDIKVIFIIGAVAYLGVLILMFVLHKLLGKPQMKKREKIKFVFHKEYKYYYALQIVYGAQKQIMAVYGPWVLIEMLNKKADTLAILGMIGAFIGIFFTAAVGRWMDRFGLKKVLYIDALSFIGVYVAYGLLSAGFNTGSLALTGWPVFLAFGIFVLDRMSMQLGMVRAVYLRSIAVKESDITPTLSLGMSCDHVVSITCAYLGGVVWSIWGPQYIFFVAAGLSLVNLFVAIRVKPKDLSTLEPLAVDEHPLEELAEEVAEN